MKRVLCAGQTSARALHVGGVPPQRVQRWHAVHVRASPVAQRVSCRLSVRRPRAVVSVRAAQAAAPWGICAAYQAVGAHCGRDIIQDQWSPCHNICTILTSIQSLLTGAAVLQVSCAVQPIRVLTVGECVPRPVLAPGTDTLAEATAVQYLRWRQYPEGVHQVLG